MQKTIITNCIDLLAGFDCLQVDEQISVFNSIIDELGSYQKPQRKSNAVEPNKELLGAYLFVSNVRNACKLGALGLWNYSTAYGVAYSNLIFALDLLIK